MEKMKSLQQFYNSFLFAAFSVSVPPCPTYQVGIADSNGNFHILKNRYDMTWDENDVNIAFIFNSSLHLTYLSIIVSYFFFSKKILRASHFYSNSSYYKSFSCNISFLFFSKEKFNIRHNRWIGKFKGEGLHKFFRKKKKTFQVL